MAGKHDKANANLRAAIGRNILTAPRTAKPAPAPTQGNAGAGSTAGQFPKTHKLSANAAIRKAAGRYYDPYEGS